MKIRTWKFKLGPFTWTRRKIKLSRTETVPVPYVRGSFPPPHPGWYQGRYWTGSEWL
jgi:hypothetical protein